MYGVSFALFRLSVGPPVGMRQTVRSCFREFRSKRQITYELPFFNERVICFWMLDVNVNVRGSIDNIDACVILGDVGGILTNIGKRVVPSGGLYLAPSDVLNVLKSL